MSTAKVGIIGANWGRVHIGAFRNAGCQVDALLGQNLNKISSVAKQESIPVATTKIEDINHLDIGVIATPVGTHQNIISMLSTPGIFCEKPLNVGKEFMQNCSFNDQVVGVNYAFVYLDTAKTAKKIIRDNKLGQINEISIEQSALFDDDTPVLNLFKDVCVHPLSWLYHVLGPFRYVSHARNEDTVSVDLDLDGALLKIHFKKQDSIGISLSMDIKGDLGKISLNGEYSPDQQWEFSPLLFNNKPVSEGEDSSDGDIWYLANCKAVETFLSVYRNEITIDEARALGYFSIEDAFKFEKFLNHLK